MIKLCANSVNLFKLSSPTLFVATGIFPDQWKMTNFTPVHGKENKQIIKNYRPISLLFIFAKVFKRIIFQKMYNRFISNNQTGFRPKYSVTTHTIYLAESIRSSFDINYEVRSVFLDMSKAFDKV